MQSRLHMVLSPEPGCLEACRTLYREGDAIILADRGVHLLFHAVPGERNSERLYALRVDVEARGLAAWAAETEVRLLGDPEWVALVTACDQVLSWK